MNAIGILLHLGKIIQAIKDVEQGISDLAHKQYKKEDLAKVLSDIKGLIDSGLIAIPGLSAAELDAVIDSLAQVL